MLAVLVIVSAGVVTHRAREFAGAVQNERTTTAHIFSARHNIFHGLRFNYYSCNYTFTVDSSLYIGLSDCPSMVVDNAANRSKSGSIDTSTGTDATVYYDPAKPSLNSLLEFRAASKNDYRIAMPWIGMVALITLFFLFGRVLTASEKRGYGRVVVDTSGTAIYPDEIQIGPEFLDVAAVQSALRDLYLEVANKIHPDRAANDVDRTLRERLMKEANAAFQRGDAGTLRRVLEDYASATQAS